MSRIRLVWLLSFIAALFLVALPVPAVDEGTPAPAEFEGQAPAIVVEQEPDTPAEQPWTSKFLIPSGLLLGGVVVFYTVVQYFTRVVRTRYKLLQ